MSLPLCTEGRHNDRIVGPMWLGVLRTYLCFCVFGPTLLGKTSVLFYSNGLAIWHSLSDITHITVNYGRWSAILHLINLKFSQGISLPETAHFVL